jgi:hypothetical protein
LKGGLGKELQRLKVVCMVKQGVDVDRDVYKLRNEPAAERAAIWQSLALIEVDPSRKVEALVKSVQILEEDPSLKGNLLTAKLQLIQQQVNARCLTNGEGRTAFEQLGQENWSYDHPHQRSVDLQCQLLAAQLAGSRSTLENDFDVVSQRIREVFSGMFEQLALAEGQQGKTSSRATPKNDDALQLTMPRLAVDWLSFDFSQINTETLDAHLPLTPAVFWLLSLHVDRALLHNCPYAAVLPVALLKALSIRSMLDVAVSVYLLTRCTGEEHYLKGLTLLFQARIQAELGIPFIHPTTAIDDICSARSKLWLQLKVE